MPNRGLEMLDCRQNRIDYGEILMPPPDYQFEYGVAATYSLDLETLLSIPIALVYGQTLEGDFTHGDARLLDAMRQFGKKVKVYHEKGCIKVPAAFNHLFAFIEDALAGILPADSFTAFHPKLWVIRYKHNDGGPDFYRVLILSRNLTFDRSWDVAGFLEGKVGRKANKPNTPLVDFISWLNKQSPIPKASEFLEGLDRASFSPPDGFDGFRFHPIGISGYTTSPLSNHSSRDTLVISPFVHKKAVSRLYEDTEWRFALLGEEHELRQLPSELLQQFPVYSLPEIIIDGERLADAEDGTGVPSSQHLHAKLFLFDHGKSAQWFLGSANATVAATDRNIEFMLELSGKDRRIGFHKVLQDLIGKENDEGPFMPFDPETADAEDKEKLKQEQEVRRITHALLSAHLEASLERSEDDGFYNLIVSLDLHKLNPLKGLKVSLSPLGSKSKPHVIAFGQLNEISFQGLDEPSISRFLRIRLELGGECVRDFLVKMKVRGIPDSRMDAVFRQLVRNSRDFFNHLRFLLATEIRKEALTDFVSLTKQSSNGSAEQVTSFDSPMYEQFLLAASRQPEKLEAVDEVVKRLKDGKDAETGEPVIPPEFLSFWEIFRTHAPPPKGSKK